MGTSITTLAVGWALLLGSLVSPPPEQRAPEEGPMTRPVPRIERSMAPEGVRWLPLGRFPIRFYGPRFQAGGRTASAAIYRPDARLASVGGRLLARLRRIPRRLTGVRRVCIARDGPCHDWGYRLRIVDPIRGRRLEVTVEDTGAGDGVDLPDATWRYFGYPPEVGRFWGDVWVRLR
jgi:hypothetical protein